MPTKFSLLLFSSILISQMACGVKGDPVPPQRSPELGRGRPTFRRATERVKVQPQVDETEEDENDDKEGVE